MKRQKSFETDGGVLYVVGTPIGNLGDLSVRTKQILGEVDLIACEDTRHTRKLLSHLGISTAMISYHGYNRLTRLPLLLDRLQEGKSIALVSDAGMPGISDPGEELIHQVVEAEIPVIPVPGANAALCALVASGLPPQPFLFIGFLPRNSKERMTELTKWKETPATLIFYEAPHRIRPMLKDVMEVLGDRKTALARELTKKHEEWMRGNLSACLQELEEEKPRGEWTVVVEGASSDGTGAENGPDVTWWQALTVREHVDWHIRRGKIKKEAIQATAAERSLPKREVYNEYHRETDD
ncbi:ribosomal RNA small subunit methyltransferase I [Kroppenstedtia guangzhouensis]|uniref:Ribosomal RNA small subunit methyltransferase I n=1 Tax=Kroppenstedtia guangzhouensis TaxID=1274356 RepID=A0ABQ1GYK8_9BACL|nr:16S rRNA (cytidine(1402)-2'-O)-methyltransferase [Kroppenstedtia guangzhouensis]GGA52462.1 ribosomal RNA small subunit methyltransferase I [Kroppenstedtia guangzhouensis]